MRAVEATIAGRRLTLIDLAHGPDAQRVRVPPKALDRLLGNRHLHAERERIHAAMVEHLRRPSKSLIDQIGVPAWETSGSGQANQLPRRLQQYRFASLSVACTSSSTIAGSAALCPASTMCRPASGQAWLRSQALVGGQMMS
jgi:hypothetical protein